MDGSIKRIKAWSSDGNPSCFSGDLSLATGVTPTVVIVRGAGTCRDCSLARNYGTTSTATWASCSTAPSR